MWATINVYRATCFGRPAGPWRLKRSAARRDAIELGLGTYDEHGCYYDIVPGGIQARDFPPSLLGLTDQQAGEIITSETHARLSGRLPQRVRRSA